MCFIYTFNPYFSRMKPFSDSHQLDKITQSLQTQILSDYNADIRQERLSMASVVLDAMAIGVLVTDEDGMITYSNARAESLLGRSRDELYGESAVSVNFFGLDIVHAQEAKSQLLQNDHWEGQLNVHNAQGECQAIRYYASVVRDEQGKLISMIASMIAAEEYQQQRHVEERSADQQIEILQTQTKAALQNANKPVWLVDTYGRIIQYNDMFAQGIGKNFKLGLKPGLKFEQLLPPAYRQRWRQLQKRALEGEPFDHEEPLLLDGKKTRYAVGIRPFKDANGRVHGVCYSSQRLHQDTPQPDQQLREEDFAKGVADERKRVGMELHDGIGQQITALQIRLNWLIVREQCTPEDLETLQREIANIQEDIRRISHNMLPLPLDSLGIEDALILLMRDTEKLGKIRVNFYAKFGQNKYPKNLEKNLYYIVQELLQNTSKHARDQKVELNISEESDVLNVIYRNNISFAIRRDADVSSGRGLMSIRDRVISLHGTLDLEHNYDSGFYIHIKLPLF